MQIRTRLIAPCLLLAVAAAAAFAQVPALERTAQADITVDAMMRRATIDSLLLALDRNYVFPEVAKAMGKAIRARQRRGEYERITSGAAFADSLTRHLQAVHADLHLRVHHSHDRLDTNLEERGPKTPEQIADDRRYAKWINQGFTKVDRLHGNVGYVEIVMFMDGDEAAETATAAMSVLANSNAIIVDLRRNGGGSPDMVAYVTTYLFGAETVHLNDLYSRKDGTTGQHWTLPHVPGRRSSSQDVFVLTSANTGSAAEEFAYNLQALKRATIVGEPTAGGANPGDMVRLGDHFAAFIANGRAINPITRTNWEGAGVQPDVRVPADDALFAAHRLALERLLAKAPDAEEKGKMQRALDALAADAAAAKSAAIGGK